MIKKLENIKIQGSRERFIMMDLTWDNDFQDKPIVIFVHGYKGFKDWGDWNNVAEYFASQGFSFLKFNFSFNGGEVDNQIDFPDLEAFSKNNYSIELDDLRLVIDWVENAKMDQTNPIDSSNIYLIGHSRGGAISIIKAAEDSRVKKLTTWAAVADLGTRFSDDKEINKWKDEGVIHVENSRTGQMMPHLYQFYEDYLNNQERLDPLKASESILVPWLIIHAEDDESVTADHAIQLSAHCHHAELLLLEQGGHTFGSSHPSNGGQMNQFLAQVCKSTASFFFGES